MSYAPNIRELQKIPTKIEVRIMDNWTCQFNEFPLGEYQTRIKRLREEMEKSNLRGIIVTDSKNIRYFAGGPVTELYEDHFNTFFLIVPLDENPTLVMSRGREDTSKTSWIEDRRFWGYGESGSVMNQVEWLDLVETTINEKKMNQGKIGMELSEGFHLGMCINDFSKLKGRLDRVEIVDAGQIIWDCRLIKSCLEIQKIEKACDITCRAYEKAFEYIKPGVSEKQVCSVYYQEIFRLGATEKGFMSLYSGAGKDRMMWADATASDRIIKEGDLIMLDGGAIIDGYHADISRMGFVGKPNKTLIDQYKIAIEAHYSVIEKIKDSLPISEACKAGRNRIVKAGLGKNLVFGGGQTGHGLGLSLHEKPDLALQSDELFKEGMVVAIEPAFLSKSSWKDSDYFLILENNYVVTKDGVKNLCFTLEDKLFITG